MAAMDGNEVFVFPEVDDLGMIGNLELSCSWFFFWKDRLQSCTVQVFLLIVRFFAQRLRFVSQQTFPVNLSFVQVARYCPIPVSDYTENVLES